MREFFSQQIREFSRFSEYLIRGPARTAQGVFHFMVVETVYLRSRHEVPSARRMNTFRAVGIDVDWRFNSAVHSLHESQHLPPAQFQLGDLLSVRRLASLCS